MEVLEVERFTHNEFIGLLNQQSPDFLGILGSQEYWEGKKESFDSGKVGEQQKHWIGKISHNGAFTLSDLPFIMIITSFIAFFFSKLRKKFVYNASIRRKLPHNVGSFHKSSIWILGRTTRFLDSVNQHIIFFLVCYCFFTTQAQDY